MIVNLSLKPYSYKAVRIHDESSTYNDLTELFGSKLLTDANTFMNAVRSNGTIDVNIYEEVWQIPVAEKIIIAEFCGEELTGVFVAENTEDASQMFDWEGEL